MGNTVLAHVLYASSCIDMDLDRFFSVTGNAHRIKSFNNTELTAEHLLEFPNPNLTCVLTLVSTGWEELLRHKMSYCKWYETEPNLNNYQIFFQNHYQIHRDCIWSDFYTNVKDPSWPRCESYDKIYQLPEYIQHEIKSTWVEPKFEIVNDVQLVEFLTISYYDTLLKASQPHAQTNIYDIGCYLSGNFDHLIKLSKDMSWQWDQQKSQDFYHAMIKSNQSYLDWLNLFKQKYKKILETKDLDWSLSVWEFSFMLAKILFDLGKNPRTIKWQNLYCSFDKKSLKLTQLIG